MSFTMPNSSQWLDTLKRHKAFDTDAEVAAFLDVSKQAVSFWRAGKHQLGTKDAWHVGLALGVNPLFIIACANYHAAKSEGARRRWRMLAGPIEPKVPKSVDE